MSTSISPDELGASPRRPWLGYVLIGLAAGFLSGMFGIGGGILIVPALVYVAKLDPKVASGTSLLAIVPVSLVGSISYAVGGNVSIWLALLLALGSVMGAPIGTRLLKVVSRRVLQSAFVVFLAVVIVSLFVVVPSRGAELNLTAPMGLLVVLLGFVTGILSGLLGIGGGVVIVPMLMLLFGVSDLLAKGSSLLMMIATGASGTVSNMRNGNVDVPAAVCVGLAASVTTSLGALAATLVEPRTGSILFAGLLVVVGGRMLADIVRGRRAERAGGAAA